MMEKYAVVKTEKEKRAAAEVAEKMKQIQEELNKRLQEQVNSKINGKK